MLVVVREKKADSESIKKRERRAKKGSQVLLYVVLPRLVCTYELGSMTSSV